MTTTERRRRVLIHAWDGVRDDELRAARTPHLDAIARRGFHATVRVHAANPTISGPVWSTVATGVYRDRHRVDDNKLHGNAFDVYPDLLARIRASLPGATTFAAAAWGPLVTEASGGPVFAGGGYRPSIPDGAENSEDDGLALIEAMDEAVASRTARELLARDHTAVFSYLLLPDMVGHTEGVTPRYREAIETCDEHLGVLLAAIEARPTRPSEDWTVIVLTDHGHLDEGDHGGDSDEERLAWIAAAGPGIDGLPAYGADHADVAPHVLDLLGIQGDIEFAGRPFGATGSRP